MSTTKIPPSLPFCNSSPFSLVILAHSFLEATISWRLLVDQIFSPLDKARMQMFFLICAICLINYSVMLPSVLVNNFMFFSCNLQGLIRGYMPMNSWKTVKGFYLIAKVYHRLNQKMSLLEVLQKQNLLDHLQL